MKPHPFAELFPLIDDVALRELADDIAENGLQQPIWTLNGQILDGRNRWKACKLAKVECQTVEYTGDDPLGFVVSLNLHRRQLTPSQLAMIGVEIESLRAKEAERQRAEKCKVFASRRTRDASGKLGSGVSQVFQKIGEPGRDENFPSSLHRSAGSNRHYPEVTLRPPDVGKPAGIMGSARQAARAVGVNHDYISKAKRIVKDAPELVRLVKSGELKLQDATILAKVPQRQRGHFVSKLEGGQGIRSVIAEARAALLKLERGHHQTLSSAVSDGLCRLRDCFMTVLAGCVDNADGEFEPLTDCVSELQLELEKAKRAWHARHQSAVSVADTRGATDFNHVGRK